MYVVFVNFSDDCTYSYNVIYAICTDEVKAIEAQEKVQKEFPDKQVEISDKFEKDTIYWGGIPSPNWK
jgi:hypothetical protein